MIISAIIILVGVFFYVTKGFNFGIDFTGGTVIEIQSDKFVEEDEIRGVFDKYDSQIGILYSGEEKKDIIIKSTKDFDTSVITEIKYAIEEKLGIDRKAISSSTTGATMGKEIQRKAFISVLIAGALMLLYITIRFEFTFGLAAICGLLHDILITLSFYAIFYYPVNSSLIAAVLTIVGYSINSTIVIFDRIREELKIQPRANREDVINASLMKTMRRSILTTFTTLVAVFTLYYVGVEAVKVLALPLVIGMCAGTYSSVLLAPNFWFMFNKGNQPRTR